MMGKLCLCSTVLLIVLYFVKFSVEFQLQISDGDEAAFCRNKYHYILTPKATCCNMTVIQPGINTETHWKECSEKKGEDNENILSSSWRIYGCILKFAAGSESEITLQKFAELMTANYEETWKKPIMDKVATITKSSTYEDMKALNAIRVAYFDIENQICSGMDSTEVDLKIWLDESLKNQERDCMSWEEENHRGGSCCGKASYPIDVQMGNFFLWVPFPIGPGACKEAIEEKLDKLEASESLRNDIALICDLSCVLVGNEKITWEDPKYWDVNQFSTDRIANLLLPTWFSASANKEALQYISSKINFTTSAINMEGYEFPGIVKTNETVEKEQGLLIYVQNITNITQGPRENTASELMRRTFPEQLLSFPTMCSIHKEILYLARHSLYLNCDTE